MHVCHYKYTFPITDINKGKQVLIKVYNSKMCKVAMNGRNRRIHTMLHTLKLFHTKKPSEMWMLIKNLDLDMAPAIRILLAWMLCVITSVSNLL